MNNYKTTTFLLSAPDLEYLPTDIGNEVAFIGSSNVGKSSAINTLTNQKFLAKISKTPGCTKLINIFKISLQCRLLDFPGYGYAQVNKKLKNIFQHRWNTYLQNRQCLQGVVLFMDLRHPLRELDKHNFRLVTDHNLPILILLSKSDKCSRELQKKTLHIVRKYFLQFNNSVQVEIFSSRKRVGIDKLQLTLNIWLGRKE
ncbi:MAG: ribosome biogenesis GTP-binding protein YihA/YsxC [Candidatus Dasytiphilus stammeri]